MATMPNEIHIFRGDFGEYVINNPPPPVRRNAQGKVDRRFKLGREVLEWERFCRKVEYAAWVEGRLDEMLVLGFRDWKYCKWRGWLATAERFGVRGRPEMQIEMR
jgi:hypothetical protein